MALIVVDNDFVITNFRTYGWSPSLEALSTDHLRKPIQLAAFMRMLKDHGHYCVIASHATEQELLVGDQVYPVTSGKAHIELLLKNLLGDDWASIVESDIQSFYIETVEKDGKKEHCIIRKFQWEMTADDYETYSSFEEAKAQREFLVRHITNQKKEGNYRQVADLKDDGPVKYDVSLGKIEHIRASIKILTDKGIDPAALEPVILIDDSEANIKIARNHDYKGFLVEKNNSDISFIEDVYRLLNISSTFQSEIFPAAVKESTGDSTGSSSSEHRANEDDEPEVLGLGTSK